MDLTLSLSILFVITAIGLLDSHTSTTNAEDKKQLYKHFSSMTTYEINQYLKDHALYSNYKKYSREGKIQKIIDRRV